jgi:membrane protein DedA with SNARE-associated domain
MFEQIITTLNTLPNEFIYFFLFINAFTEYLFPPFPGDAIMIFGAYLVGTGKLDLLTVYCVSTIGSVSGFLVLFSFGKHYGREFFLRKNYRFFSKEMILEIEEWFQRYGIGLIAANRFFSGVRSVISLFAGIANMKVMVATLAALTSSVIWNAVLISGGYFLGKNWQVVLTILKRYNQAIITLLVLFLLFYLWKRNKKKKEGAP